MCFLYDVTICIWFTKQIKFKLMIMQWLRRHSSKSDSRIQCLYGRQRHTCINLWLIQTTLSLVGMVLTLWQYSMFIYRSLGVIGPLWFFFWYPNLQYHELDIDNKTAVVCMSSMHNFNQGSYCTNLSDQVGDASSCQL